MLFETAPITAGAPPPVRYGVRQVLDQEYQKNIIVRENAARQARYKAGGHPDDNSEFAIASEEERKSDKADVVVGAKKDFFGRVLREAIPLGEIDGSGGKGKGDEEKKKKKGKDDNKVWVTFHEGFSNAVRKPITIDELLRGL